MNAKSLIAAAALATLAGAAFAETPLAAGDIAVPHAATRASVQADLAAYKQAGVNPWSTSYNPVKNFKSTTTRAQVTAEYIAARDEVAAINSEDGGSSRLATAPARRDASATLAGTPRAIGQ